MYGELEKKLGYHFRDASLLTLALRHPSGGRPNNQRLEFLGDAVLQLAVSHSLYQDYPADQEGKMTFIRQQAVCEETLAAVARSLGLGACLQMEHGLARQGGRNADAPLADAMEAVLAAVYLDGGFEAALQLILRLFPVHEGRYRMDAKSALQQVSQARFGVLPEYVLLAENGPEHQPDFTVLVRIGDREYGRGTGRTKKGAEQDAAQHALEILSMDEDIP